MQFNTQKQNIQYKKRTSIYCMVKLVRNSYCWNVNW